MAKKVVSVALHKKKPIKHRNKRKKKLKSVFKKILNYMKSDTYLFAPLLHRQSHLTSAPASFGEVCLEPIKKKEQRLVQDVNDYLKCDCYMYAPLVLDSAHDGATLYLGDRCRGEAGSASVHDQMGPRNEEIRKNEANTPNSTRDIVHDDDDSYNSMSRIVVKHKTLQVETVKRVVHQNCRSSSVPAGDVLSQKKRSKIVVE